MQRRTEAHRLGAVLFTDVVGSTAIAAEMGNTRWVELVARHHRIVRRQIHQFAGREIDTAGDGFFVTFERPQIRSGAPSRSPTQSASSASRFGPPVARNTVFTLGLGTLDHRNLSVVRLRGIGIRTDNPAWLDLNSASAAGHPGEVPTPRTLSDRNGYLPALRFEEVPQRCRQRRGHIPGEHLIVLGRGERNEVTVGLLPIHLQHVGTMGDVLEGTASTTAGLAASS